MYDMEILSSSNLTPENMANVNKITDAWLSDPRYKRNQKDRFALTDTETGEVTVVSWQQVYSDAWKILAPSVGNWQQVWIINNTQLLVTQKTKYGTRNYKIATEPQEYFK